MDVDTKVVEVVKERDVQKMRRNEEETKAAERLIERRPVSSDVGTDDPVEFIRSLAEEEGWSTTEIGKEIGYHSSVVSKVLNNCYTGDAEAVKQACADAMNRLLGSGRGALVRTDTSVIIEETLRESLGREWMSVVYGDPGIGKTETINRTVQAARGKRGAYKAVVVTITATATAGTLLYRLASALGIDPCGQVERLFDRIVDELKRERRLLVFDEMNNLSRAPARAARIVNVLRQINDAAKTGMVFVGTSGLTRLLFDPKNRDSMEMLLSRIRLQVQLPGASLVEARALLMAHFGPLDWKAWDAFQKGYESALRSWRGGDLDLESGSLRLVAVFSDNAKICMAINKSSKAGNAPLTAEIANLAWQRMRRARSAS